MIKKLWIYGAGGHAVVVIDIIKKMKTFVIEGLIDDDLSKKGFKILGSEAIGDFNVFESINEKLKIQNIFLAIGDNSSRARLSEMLKNFSFPTIIHCDAIIGDNVKIGRGTVVMPGAIIEANVSIGEQCIINNHAVIGHGSYVGDFCHIGGGAILSGQTTIGSRTLIGIGACITPNIKIGTKCLIGAGSVVSKAVADETFVMGKPARIISNFLRHKRA
ncbi:acetyltransferase [candidate division KSB1 bacterium]|nr:acetyltransferase [candidate division KSB1 bacterium]